MSNTITIGGVACTVYFGEDEEQALGEEVTDDGPVATVRYKCDWSRRYDVLRGLAGSAVAAGAGVLRIAPHQYPLSPNLYCMAIPPLRFIKPRWQNGFVAYDQAIITAVYKPPRWQFSTNPPSGQNDPSGQPWTTTRFRASGEVFSPPGGAYYFTSGTQAGQKIEESAVGLIRPKAEISMTRHWMPWAPVAESIDAIGRLNLNPIIFGNKTFAKGTILFAGVNSTESWDTLGNLTFEWEYALLAQEQDWNAVMDRAGAWAIVNTLAAGTGSFPFPYSDWYFTLP